MSLAWLRTTPSVFWVALILSFASSHWAFFFDSPRSNNVRMETVSVQWDGGVAVDCDNCSSTNTTKQVEAFACNAERWGGIGGKPGNWSNGVKFFRANITSDEMVKKIDVTLWGRFHCSFISIGQAEPTIFSISVQGIPLTTNPQEFPGCPFCSYCITCDACVVPLTISGMTYSNGWPAFNYEGYNVFAIVVEQSVVCMSEAILTFTVVPRDDASEDGLKAPVWVVALVLGFGLLCLFGAVILFVLAGRRWKLKKTEGKESRQFISVNTYGSAEVFHSAPGSPLYKEKEMPYDEISLGPRIGKGSYGEVFRGTWRGTEVAIKKLPYYFSELGDSEEQDTFLQDFLRETELMKTLRHPNIVQLYAATSHPEVCMVMEFMHRGSLYSILHSQSIRLSWDLLKRIMLDAAKGMTYLHNSKPVIIHRDLKSHNLLIDQHWRTKVSDFGLSRMVEMSAMATMTSCGTPSWTAPEVLRGEKYTEKCDVYAYGIVLWECVTRENPHQGLPHFQIVFQVGTQGLRPKIPPDCPHAWARLITDCWTENPEERPTFEEIISRLEKF